MKKIYWIIILIVLIVGLLSVVLIKKSTTANVIKDGSSEMDWAKENCNCTERNNLKCPEGYIVDGRICKGTNKTTNPLLGCSKYDCNGTIYEVKL